MRIIYKSPNCNTAHCTTNKININHTRDIIFYIATHDIPNNSMYLSSANLIEPNSNSLKLYVETLCNVVPARKARLAISYYLFIGLFVFESKQTQQHVISCVPFPFIYQVVMNWICFVFFNQT